MIPGWGVKDQFNCSLYRWFWRISFNNKKKYYQYLSLRGAIIIWICHCVERSSQDCHCEEEVRRRSNLNLRSWGPGISFGTVLTSWDCFVASLLAMTAPKDDPTMTIPLQIRLNQLLRFSDMFFQRCPKQHRRVPRTKWFGILVIPMSEH